MEQQNSAGIGRIERRPLRTVWLHEERDFTVWLRDNIDVISEQLGFELINPEREQAAGQFSVDIVAETSDGRAVVIENQLERSDHDHLGKLLTYLASFEARVAIWIVSEPRPEHVQAITWLNQAGLVDFYMFKVEAVVIGVSAAAPLLTKIVGPSYASTIVGATKKEFAERYEVRQRFWSLFLPQAAASGALRAGRAVSTDNWMDRREGSIAWLFTIREHETQMSLYVDGYSPLGNNAYVEAVELHRAEIEAALGAPLEWEASSQKKHAKVWTTNRIGGYRDEDRWPQIQDAMLESYRRLREACAPFLEEAAAAATAAAGVPAPAEPGP